MTQNVLFEVWKIGTAGVFAGFVYLVSSKYDAVDEDRMKYWESMTKILFYVTASLLMFVTIGVLVTV